MIKNQAPKDKKTNFIKEGKKTKNKIRLHNCISEYDKNQVPKDK